MNAEELKKILENHKHWLAEDCEGWETMKADLSGADLRRADLRRADLSAADLRHADLRRADLRGADLSGAKISGADLRCADLRHADLRSADIRCADLSGANLRGADLRHADLSGADLRCADISGADLSGAVYDHLTAFFAMACPEEGSFIGWKKVDGYIVKLRIPEDAKRSSATSRKCRCSKAEVLEIQNRDGSKADVDSIVNTNYAATTYTVGETVHADSWDEDRWNECSNGIHFFITRDEAVTY